MAHNVMVWFGEWAVLRECQSLEEAEESLRYEQTRVSWPLRIESA